MATALAHVLAHKNSKHTLCDLPYIKKDYNLKVEIRTFYSRDYLLTSENICRECAGLELRHRRIGIQKGSPKDKLEDLFEYEYKGIVKLVEDLREMAIDGRKFDMLYFDEFLLCFKKYMDWCKGENLDWNSVHHGISCDRKEALLDKGSQELVNKWQSIVKEHWIRTKINPHERDEVDIRVISAEARKLNKEVKELTDELKIMQRKFNKLDPSVFDND